MSFIRLNLVSNIFLIAKTVPYPIEFSGEFSAKPPPHHWFATGKPPNSLENSTTNRRLSFSRRHLSPAFRRLKTTTDGHKNRTANLSPSCHPCHPQKRVQTPCTSAFCHPVTLFVENRMYQRGGIDAPLRIISRVHNNLFCDIYGAICCPLVL